MKVQNLAIIFLIIIIPLIMILGYYLHLQQETLELQAEYDTKLGEATKGGIKAFEINTVDWSEWVSERTNAIARTNALATINTFITSLANNLNIAGTAKEFMLNYIPAVAVTMYDGYYIYAPTYNPVTKEDSDGVQLFFDTDTKDKITTDSEKGKILYEAQPGEGTTYFYEYENEDGTTIKEQLNNLTTDIEKAIREYSHTLNNKMFYSSHYTRKNVDLIINYTLDNKISVYGEDINKNGYLVYFNNNSLMPRANTIGTNPRKDSDISVARQVKNTIYNDTYVDTEILEEQVLYMDENDSPTLKTFKYVYDIEHIKLYYDEYEDNFFTINKDKKRNWIVNEPSIKIGSTECRYKSVSILWGDSDSTTEYKKIYQALNGRDKGKWCISIKNENKVPEGEKEKIDTEIKSIKLKEFGLDDARFSTIYRDYSAISYYVEAYAFTNWAKQNLGGNITQQKIEEKFAYNAETGKYDIPTGKFDVKEETLTNIFDISENNDPEKSDSPIVEHKKEVMKDNVTTNLNLSISNYNRNGKYDFKLPVLSDKDWEQVFSNISLITFLQGIPIGLKYYNNYAIATSTTNREYVDPEEIYFSGEDKNYHRVYCEKCNNQIYTGYRSVEYVLKEYTKEGKDNIYYYQHDTKKDSNSETACYYCLVNKSNFVATTNPNIRYTQAKSYNEALARERYYQKESLEGKIGVNITYEANLEPNPYIVESVQNVNPNMHDCELNGSHIIISEIPKVKVYNDVKWNLKFVEWNTAPDGSGKGYSAGDIMSYITEDTTLYAQWQVDLRSLEWKYDNLWPSSEDYHELFNENNYTPSWGSLLGYNRSSLIFDSKNVSYIWLDFTKNYNVRMTGNPIIAGKGAAWAIFDNKVKNHYESTGETVSVGDIATLSFNYDLDFGDSFGGAGVIFNLSGYDDNSNVISGYMLSFNYITPPDSCGVTNIFYKTGKNASLWKFNYRKGTNTQELTAADCLHIKDLDIPTRGKLTIETTDNEYSIYYQNSDSSSKQLKAQVDNVSGYMGYYNPNAFGFFSSHYLHGCSCIGRFELENIEAIPKLRLLE